MKKKYAKKSDIPKDQLSHYQAADDKQPDGAHVLILEDDDDSGTGTDETAEEKRSFRERNVLLQKELAKADKRMAAMEDRLKQFEGLDLNAARKGADLINSQKSEEERKLLADGKIDEVVDRRTSTMKSHHDATLKAKQKEFEDLQAKYQMLDNSYSQQLVTTSLSSALEETGVRLRKGARADVEARVNKVFKRGEKGLDAFDEDGEPRYAKNGKQYGIKDFVMDLVEQAPHLIEASGGGGGNQTQTGRSSAKGGNSAGIVVIDRNDVDTLGRNAQALKEGKVKLT